MENLSEVKKAVDSVPPEGKAKAKTIVKAEASGGKSPAKAGGKGGGQVSPAGFFLDISKKTQGQEKLKPKKTQGNFRKTQGFANSQLEIVAEKRKKKPA